jgi:hypothetical protein
MAYASVVEIKRADVIRDDARDPFCLYVTKNDCIPFWKPSEPGESIASDQYTIDHVMVEDKPVIGICQTILNGRGSMLLYMK